MGSVQLEELLVWNFPNTSTHIQTMREQRKSASRNVVLVNKESFPPRTEQFQDMDFTSGDWAVSVIRASIGNVCSCGRTPREKTKAKKKKRIEKKQNSDKRKQGEKWNSGPKKRGGQRFVVS